MARFVVLRHQRPQDTHWDLLIEVQDQERLATWQIAVPPERWGGEDIPAVRLSDHRRIYLEYEGEISGNRGHVTRVESGTATVHLAADTRWQFHLHGQTLRGTFELTAAGESWTLRATREPGPIPTAGSKPPRSPRAPS